MFYKINETFRSSYRGVTISRPIEYYIVEFKQLYYALKHYSGKMDTSGDGDFNESDNDYKYLIACCETKDKAIFYARKYFKNTTFREIDNKLSADRGLLRHTLDIRDGVCYHVTKASKRENIDLRGLRPKYDSDLRHFIDCTLDNIRYKMPGMYQGVSRENSVFLYPSIRDAISTAKKNFSLCDIYRVNVNPDKIWLAPSSINDMLTFNYQASSMENEVYFDNLRRLGAQYWKQSCSVKDFNFEEHSVNNYEALAYDGYESIKSIQRVGMFSEQGLYYPLSNFDFYTY